jgi:hypothetical protein
MKKLLLILMINLGHANYLLNTSTGECTKLQDDFEILITAMGKEGFRCKKTVDQGGIKGADCTKSGVMIPVIVVEQAGTCLYLGEKIKEQ